MSFNSAIVAGVPGTGVDAPTPPNFTRAIAPININMTSQANVGDMVNDDSTGDIYMLNYTKNVGRAWVTLALSSGTMTFLKASDGNLASPILGVVTVAQANGILTTAASHTLTVGMSNNYTASSGGYNITGTNNFVLNLISTVASSAAGPYLTLYRNRTAANSDSIGGILFAGNNSTPAVIDYAKEQVVIDDKTAGAEYGSWTLYTMQNGTLTAQINASSTGLTTITGNLTVTGTTSSGATTVASLTVTGAATVGTTLGVTGATTLSSTLGVTGATTLSSTLSAGVTTINAGTATTALTLTSTSTSTNPSANIVLYKNKATPAVSDYLSSIYWNANNSTPAQYTYGALHMQATNVTAGAEEANMVVSLASAGSYLIPLQVAPAAITVTGSLGVTGNTTLTSSSADMLDLISTANTANGSPTMTFYKNRAATVNDAVGNLAFYGNNSTPIQFQYSAIQTAMTNVTAGTEAAAVTIYSREAGSLVPEVVAGPTGVNVRGWYGGAAAAGYVGEVITTYTASGSAVNINNTAANIASISLTKGIWTISGCLVYTVNSATIVGVQAGISNTSATFTGNNGSDYCLDTTDAAAINDQSFLVPQVTVSITSTTIYYLVGKLSVGPTSATGYGNLTATRIA